ncbi:MAG: glycosyltransferase [Phycisphaerae bacterium]|nr:glycosyltransferase [Phycisphaerae bacterium]
MVEKKLRILVLSPIEPYPPNGGWPLVIYNDLVHLRLLGHQLHLLAIMNDPAARIEPMKKICPSDYFYKHKLPRWWRVVINTGKYLSFGFAHYIDESLLARARELLGEQKFDVVLVEDVMMSTYGPALRKEFEVPFFVRGHNVGTKVLQRFTKAQKNPILKVLAIWQGRKYARYERTILADSDGFSMITETDAMELKGLFPELEPSVVSAGTDLDYFQPNNQAREPDLIVHVGSLTAFTKLEAMIWFCERVLPLIRQQRPNVRLELAGYAPAKVFAKFEGVNVLGRVPDVRPHLTHGRVFVAPQFVGSGIRLKILNAMATANAIVCTPIACEGIGLINDEHALVREDAKGFAQAVLSILSNDELTERLGTKARRFVEEKYNWKTIVEGLAQLLYQVSQKDPS